MEDTLQKVFAILLSVVVFFLLPLYMAFEKKDDISYSMALRITSNFVDNVTNKGYITRDMYNNFISDLALTGNSYEVTMQHKAKKYYPVIYANSKNADNAITTKEYDYNLNKDKYKSYLEGNDINDLEEEYVYNKNKDNTLTLNYKLEELLYTEKQILGTFDGSVNAVGGTYKFKDENGIEMIYYPMSKGDEFTVVIKNTNTTIASILFNTLTMGVNEETPKVYINYGGSIQNESYRKTAFIGDSTNVEDTKTNQEGLVDVACSVVLNEDHPVGTLYGDVNEDGYINTLDYNVLDNFINNNIGQNIQLNYINSDIDGKDNINGEDRTILNDFIKGTNKVLVSRGIDNKSKYTYYVVFSNPVKIRDGKKLEDAITIVSKDLDGSNEKEIKINSFTSVDDKKWELVVPLENKEKVQEITINADYFVNLYDENSTNLKSSTLKVHFIK